MIYSFKNENEQEQKGQTHPIPQTNVYRRKNMLYGPLDLRSWLYVNGGEISYYQLNITFTVSDFDFGTADGFHNILF